MTIRIYTVFIAAILALSSALALQTININSGDSFTVTSDAGFSVGKVSEIASTYTIADIGFFDQRVIPNPRQSSITKEITVNAPEGLYTLIVKTFKNKKLVQTEEFLLVVHPGTYVAPVQPPKPGSTNNTTSKPTTPAVPLGPTPLITIPRIPDVEAGTTLVVPVTITGKGRYAIAIPRLSFATYEAPSYVDVNGEKTIPVLLHIDQKAQAGVYTLPITAGTEQASTRIRIIAYHKENYWWFLIPVGILLIIMGILLLFQKKRTQPYEPQRPLPPATPPRDKSGDLITYY